MKTLCNARYGELLCGLHQHGASVPHQDGEATWRDGDPLPPRTKDHVIGAGGYCGRCRRYSCLDVDLGDEPLSDEEFWS